MTIPGTMIQTLLIDQGLLPEAATALAHTINPQRHLIAPHTTNLHPHRTALRQKFTLHQVVDIMEAMGTITMAMDIIMAVTITTITTRVETKAVSTVA